MYAILDNPKYLGGTAEEWLNKNYNLSFNNLKLSKMNKIIKELKEDYND